MARKGVGRKKIPMKKIENESNLQVTFSKRRSGIYKKACELSILCNCYVAIVIFSAMKKIYAFGHPSVEQILYTFISGDPEQNRAVQHLMENDNSHEFCQVTKERAEYEAIIESEKTREKAITKLQFDHCDENSLQNWGFTPVEELTLAEAEKELAKLMELENFINSSGEATTSSLMHTNGVSLVVPPRDGFPLTIADPNVASTSYNYKGKGKAPIQD